MKKNQKLYKNSKTEFFQILTNLKLNNNQKHNEKFKN
jgi:hypothetical protein